MTHALIYVTQAGYEKLKDQLKAKEQEYAVIRERRHQAFELSGDGWHDNPEFNRMQQMEANLNHTIKSLTERLLNTRLIEVNECRRNTHLVSIGSIVAFTRWSVDGDQEHQDCWEITGFDETCIERKMLAYNAPLARAMMGLRLGDFAEDQPIGDGRWDIEITELYPSRQLAGL